MKRVIFWSLTMLFSMSFCAITLADSVIVTETKTWKNVPIDVDTSTHTYTVNGPVPANTSDYYYGYTGFRCFTKQRIISLSSMTLKASAVGGSDIYCYPE